MTDQQRSADAKLLIPEPAPMPHVEGLHRRLGQRQLSMMAIGGAIGVGLFLGSSVTIRLAGPAVILSYLLGAGIALIHVVAAALAEMAVVHPVAGAFGVYAEKYLNPWAGFSVRATYGVAQIIAIGAEVTAAGIYDLRFSFPNVPQWIWVVLVSAALVALNSMQVNRLGEFEYWFAAIKVAAIVAFIFVGLSLIIGLGPRSAIGFANLTQRGGFLPLGWKGVWLSLTITVTSYMGVEIIAVTAGEAERPEVSIPRAMRSIVWRLILFYVLAIAIMVTMVPWNSPNSSSLSASPFVTAFAAAHIPFAAAIMNFVVLTAALSSVNTNLYLSTRMLFSLGRGGYAPQWMGTVSGNGVPHRALLASTAGIIAAILLAVFAPKNAFLMLYGTAVAGMLFVWLVILGTHLSFRKAITSERLTSLPMRLWAHPLFTVVGILLLLAISVTTFFVDGLQWSVPAFAVFLGLISLLYWRTGRSQAS